MCGVVFAGSRIWRPTMSGRYTLAIPGTGKAARRVTGRAEEDATRPAEARQADESAVRNLLSSESGQKALKSANLDLQKVDTAVSQLGDEDLAKLAERSRQAQKDFAAGKLSDRDLLWIILIIVAVLIVALAVR